MIDPTTIKRGDKFKVTAQNGLYDLQKYQTRNGTSLKTLEGWKKTDGNLMSVDAHQQANFELPIIKDGLGLPSLTVVNELIQYLETGAEIETIQVLFHSNSASKDNKAYQCLLISTIIGGITKFGFIWTTHGGIDYAEPIENEEQNDEQEEPPIPDTDPIDNTDTEEDEQVDPIDEDELPIPPEPDKDKIAPITGEKIHVHAGETTVVELHTAKKEIKNKKQSSVKMYRVVLVDEKGNQIKGNYKVIFIDQHLKEKEINIVQGKGGTDTLESGLYTVIIDNCLENCVKPLDSINSSISIENINYVRPGFLYKVTNDKKLKANIYTNSTGYKSNWGSGGVSSEAYYKGVYSDELIPDLPPRTTKTINLGELPYESYIRIDKVLFYSHAVSNKGRLPLFFAGNISTPTIQGKDRFTWLVYDENFYKKPTPIAEIAKTQVNIEGPSTIYLEANSTEIKYGRKKGLAVNNSKTVVDPKVSSINWIVPQNKSNDLRVLYYKNRVGDAERILGAVYHRRGQVIITIQLSKELELNQTLPVSVNFVYKKISERNQIFGNREDTRTLELTVDDKVAPLTYEYRIRNISQFFPKENNKFILYQDIIQLSVEYTNDLGSRYFVMSSEFLYPVLQKLLVYYPGVLASRLEVLKAGSNNEYVETWPESTSNLLLAECNTLGEAIYQSKADLKVLEEIAGTIDICEADERMKELITNSNIFPQVFLESNLNPDNLIEHVVYLEIGYDWRLPLNSYRPADIKPRLQQFEIDYPFLAYIGRKLKSTYSQQMLSNPFLDEKFSLAGHSTGGIIVKALSSLDSEIKNNIDSLFFISVPFWGAPKGETMFLTGDIDDPVMNIAVRDADMREISANMPVTYILSAQEDINNRRYSGEKFDIKSREERFNQAAYNGLFQMYPEKILPRTSKDRKSLRFNKYLAEMSNKFYMELEKQFPNTIPSYVFFSSNNDTIERIEFPNPIDVNLFPKVNVGSLVGNETILDIIGKLNNQILPESLKKVDSFYLDNSRVIKYLSQYEFDDEVRVSTIQEGQAWQIYDENKLKDVCYVVALIDNQLSYRKLIKSDVDSFWTTNPLNVIKKPNGDGTVPEISQKGIIIDHPNAKIKCFKELEGSPKHMKTPNQKWVWERVVKVLKGGKIEDSDFE